MRNFSFDEMDTFRIEDTSLRCEMYRVRCLAACILQARGKWQEQHIKQSSPVKREPADVGSASRKRTSEAPTQPEAKQARIDVATRSSVPPPPPSIVTKTEVVSP